MLKSLLILIAIMAISIILFFVVKKHRKEAIALQYKDYKYISEQGLESENYELIRVADHWRGPRLIDGVIYLRNIYYDTATQNIVFLNDLTEYKLWKGSYMETGPRNIHYKMDGSGHNFDSLRIDNLCLDNSGVFFDSTFYVDWVNTDDKTKKKYRAIIDGGALSEKEIEKLVNEADQVAIDNDNDNKKALIFLKNNDQWSVISSAKHYDNVNGTVGWLSKATLEPFLSKREERFIEIPYFYDRINTDSAKATFLTTEHFAKEHKHRNSLGDFNNTSRAGWSGTGYFKIRYKSEAIHFKAAAFNGALNGSSIYFPLNDNHDFVIIHISKSRYNDTNYDNTGVFILRRKQ